MHPAFYFWWKNARRAHTEGHEAHAEHGGCGGGPGARGRHDHHGRHGEHHGRPDHDAAHFGGGHDEPFGGGPFGVRRPLRFLAHKLELTDSQVEELARILNELKTERAQAEVDHQRTIAAFADALEGPAFGDERATEGGKMRVDSAEKLRVAVVRALGRIHAVLDEAQRKKLAYLVRTGTLTI